MTGNMHNMYQSHSGGDHGSNALQAKYGKYLNMMDKNNDSYSQEKEPMDYRT